MTSFTVLFFFFSSRRRHTRWPRDWSSDVCSSDLADFIARKERKPRVQQAQFQVLAQEKRLRRAEQCQVGAFHVLDPHELLELAEQLRDQPFPYPIGLTLGGGRRLRARF